MSTDTSDDRKRRDQSPLENIPKKQHGENMHAPDNSSNTNPHGDVLHASDNASVAKPTNSNFLRDAKLRLEKEKSKQLYAIQNSTSLDKSSKQLALTILEVVAPLFGSFIESIDDLVTNQVNHVVEEAVERKIQENNTRIQNCLIETVFQTDKAECRMRYRNLRITGLSVNENESPRQAVLRFAETHGQKMNSKQIVDIETIKPKNPRHNITYLTKFATDQDREQFITAKFAAIEARKTVQDEIRALRDTQNDDDQVLADRKFKTVFLPLKATKIQEDLTSRRMSLLRLVSNSENVKYSYTRNAVIHAIVGNRKVKIFSPGDLYRIGFKDIPLNLLDLPQEVRDIASASPSINN